MNSVICTLFEGNYHYGLASLTNSLFANGFRGDVFIGYKGVIPFWANSAEAENNINWDGAKLYSPIEGVNLYFLPVNTKEHFTNYKAEFMLKLWDGPAKNAVGMFYFDPDIVIKCNWSFYESWKSMGVCLVNEIVWNDMPSNHPKRMMWRKVAEKAGCPILNNLSSYINAGFIGISKENIGFLEILKNLIDVSKEHFSFNAELFFQSNNDYGLFKVGDQDLLNLAAMCSSFPLSIVGPEGMDFIGGGWIMSHAVGSPKPWNKNYFMSSLNGLKPTNADKEYWKYCNFPIQLMSSFKVEFKKASIKTSSFIGRFYSK
jgi:hypothetical protein